MIQKLKDHEIPTTLFLPCFEHSIICSGATKSKKEAQPPLKFTVLEIERQNIPYGSEDLFVFEFKNTSKKAAVITNVQTSCGCTAAERPETPIRKGKKGLIKVHYDTKRVGGFTKTITVFSNVGDPIVLTIKGTVLSPSDSPVIN